MRGAGGGDEQAAEEHDGEAEQDESGPREHPGTVPSPGHRPGTAPVVAASGFAAGFINPVLGAVIFERIPSHLVGRVSSLTTATCFALIPLGGLLGGLLVTGAGLPVTMLAVGAAYLPVTMLPAVDPRWREIDARRPVAVRVQENAAAT